MTGTLSRRSTPDSAWRMGMWLTIAASCMMFTGLTSAYVVSEGLGPAWQQLAVRPLMGFNTLVLLLSSGTLEHARHRAKKASGMPLTLPVTVALGLLFLGGQLALFRQFGETGYYLNTGRQSSFFYVLTGLHALHVVAGIVALSYVALRLRNFNAADPRRCVRMDVVSLFWHFVGILWVWLLVVLFA